MCVLASVLAGFIALVMLINLSESRYFPEGGILLLIAALIFGSGMTLFQWQQRRILERAIRFNEGKARNGRWKSTPTGWYRFQPTGE